MSYRRDSMTRLDITMPTTSYELTMGKDFTFNIDDKQLHVCNARPFKILNKLNDDAYVIDFSKDFRISPTFNIKDLVDSKGLDFILLIDKPSSFSKSPSFSPLSEIHPNTTNKN